jgi:hypothetical protein
MKCESCGANNPDYKITCVSCGLQLAELLSDKMQAENSSDVKPKKGFWRIAQAILNKTPGKKN